MGYDGDPHPDSGRLHGPDIVVCAAASTDEADVIRWACPRDLDLGRRMNGVLCNPFYCPANNPYMIA
jgi:hypothetical protein